MKLHRCYQIPPLYDVEVEIDVDLRRTFAGPTFIVTGITWDGYDLYDHPNPEQANAFLHLAHTIQGIAERDDTILDELLEDTAREAV